MIDPAFILALGAVLWSLIQQYQINSMCNKCPFLPKNSEEWTKKEKVAQSSLK